MGLARGPLTRREYTWNPLVMGQIVFRRRAESLPGRPGWGLGMGVCSSGVAFLQGLLPGGAQGGGAQPPSSRGAGEEDPPGQTLCVQTGTALV